MPLGVTNPESSTCLNRVELADQRSAVFTCIIIIIITIIIF